MAFASGRARDRFFRTWWLPLLLATLVAVGAPLAGIHLTSGGTPRAHTSGPPSPAATAPVRSGPIHPSVNLTSTFFQNDSRVGQPSSKYLDCLYGFECFPQAQDPSVVQLANGNIGIGFSFATNYSANTCAMAKTDTAVRVGFEISANGGVSFGATKDVGNDTCPYIQALEPSFAVNSYGTVVGTYIEANATFASTVSYNGPVNPYTSRAADALAFVSSSNNGTSFAKAKTIYAAGNLSRPAIATFGSSVYVVFENISNGTALLPGPGFGNYPISVQLLYSPDNGTTWQGPYTLPGLNSSQYWTSMSPSIAVNSTGTVGVAYATNRSCIAFCALTYTNAMGDDIVVATSSTNGTAWNGPFTVFHATGESNYYSGSYFYSLFEYAPTTAIAYDPSSGNWYVTWAGSYNLSLGCYYCYYYDYQDTDVYAGVSSNGGLTWTTELAAPPLWGDPNNPYYVHGYYNPGLGVNGGTVYLTYSAANLTYYGGCGGSSSYTSISYSQYLTSSPDGIAWGSHPLLALWPGVYGGYSSYVGALSSVGFTTGGNPVIGFALPSEYQYTGVSLVYPVNLTVATPYSGSTTTLTVNESGLAAGTPWTFQVGGIDYTQTGSTLSIPNAPKGIPVLALWPGPAISIAYRTNEQGVTSLGESLVLTGPTTDYLNFTAFYGIQILPEPNNIPYFSLYFYNASNYSFNYYWETYTYAGKVYHYSGGCAFPWYFRAGTVLNLTNLYSYPVEANYYSQIGPIDYWSGVGAGSYTGFGHWANLTVDSPFNETAWFLAYGVYSEEFNAIGLTSTSTYNFTINGQSYGNTGSNPTIVDNLTTGPYWLSSVSATSSQAGWEYFGRADVGNPIVIPNDPEVNLTFAYVDVAAAPVTETFYASGLTTGTVWQISVNGTTYSSSSPWLNLTLQPGVYPVSGYPVVSENTSAGYVPTGVPTFVNVTGTTYTLNFQSAYRLDVLAGNGGSVSPTPGSFWLSPGTTKTFTATANPGFVFDGWSGTGAGAFTGMNTTATVTANGPIVESANFYPVAADRFNLTVMESGIPAGVWWTIYLDGKGYSSDTPALTVPSLYSCAFSGNLGHYALTVPYAYANGTNLTRYVPMSPPGTVCGGTTQTLTFQAQYYLTVEQTPGGNVTVSFQSTITFGSTWAPGNIPITLSAIPASTLYEFLGWNGTGPGNVSAPGGGGCPCVITITLGGPVSEVAVFQLVPTPPPPTYWIDFHTTAPLPAGTVWTVTVAGTTYSSSSSDLIVSGLVSKSYALSAQATFSPDRLSQFAPTGLPASVLLTKNTTLQVAFQTSYWVKIAATGPGTVTPASGWIASGGTISLSATPIGSNLFVRWDGTGTGSYSGTDAQQSVKVTAPISETASFAPPQPAAKVVSSSWSAPGLWAGFAIVGLVVGAVLGIVLGRMLSKRRPPAAAVEPWNQPEAPSGGEAMATEEAPPDAGGEAPPEEVIYQ
jgi:hypothetical protein